MPLVPPEASVAATGLSIRYIGSGEYQHCYGNSGEISTNNETLTALEFHSGSGYILAAVYWGVDSADLDADKFVGLFIKLNEQLIYQTKSLSRVPYDTSGPSAAYVEFLIPPNTKVEIQVGTDRTSIVNQTVTLSGRVYGTE